MLKVVRKIIICIIAIFFVIWISSIIKCEINTYKLKDELCNAEGSPAGNGKLKVLYCNQTYAYVYWHNDEFGHTLSYIKDESEKWKVYEWEICIWSHSGSADGFIWPYIR